jgi:hypothetical protein
MTTVGGGRERTCGRAPSLAALREGSRKTERGGELSARDLLTPEALERAGKKRGHKKLC